MPQCILVLTLCVAILSCLSVSSASLVTESEQTVHGALSLLESITSQVDGGILALPRTTKVDVDLHCMERQRIER